MNCLVKIIKGYMQLCMCVCMMLFAVSCQSTSENANLMIDEIGNVNKENFISYEEICDKACSIYSKMVKEFGAVENGMKSSFIDINNQSRSIRDVSSFNDAKGITALYAVNFEEGGFIIMSADKRMPEVLAISEDRSFETKEDRSSEMPGGLKIWIEDMSNSIAAIRYNPPKDADSFTNDDIATYSDEVSTRNVPANTPYLLSTTWGQRKNYNDSLQLCIDPYIKVPAGCTTVAICQLLKYHMYPNYYSWSAMANNYATTTTAKFIKDIYTLTGATSEYASAECSTTGVIPYIRWTLSYLNYQYSDANYNTSIIENEVYTNKRPILLHCLNQGGHMWICDGVCFVQNPPPSHLLRPYYHMNWGWYGQSDGWFLSNDYNVTSGIGSNYTFPLNQISMIKVWLVFNPGGDDCSNTPPFICW